MLIDRWREIETLYHSACKRKPEERRAYLESACGGDESLRLEVESLLAHEELAATFLETHESTTPGNAVEASVAAGQQIGPYLVVEFLQKGGMGEVYKARDMLSKSSSYLHRTRCGRVSGTAILGDGIPGRTVA